jgi:pimeloyl-ACP methyl ester carboxylesterase
MNIQIAERTGPSLPQSFQSQLIRTPDAELFVQIAGNGSATVLLHGYVQTGDMWGPLASELAKKHTVIVPDLRGLGRSSRPPNGYDKKAQAQDIHRIVKELGFDQAVIVGHDLGGMIAYAYAAQFPANVGHLIIMEAALPGIPPWNAIANLPGVWHFNFRGPDAERLVKGRVSEADFTFSEAEVEDPQPGQMLLRTLWLSLDPLPEFRCAD